MSAFTGTWRVTRLALRRDRVKLPLWVVAIAALLTSAVPTIKEAYGTSQQALMQYASTTAHSFVARFLIGPIGGPELGAVLMNEYFVFISVIVAFVSTMAIVRHTRQNEELGRSELIGSGVVGRYAPLTAALVTVIGTNLLLITLIALGLIASDGLPASGAIAMALAYGGVGIVFAGIAAVVTQVVGSARGANAAIGGIVGIAIILRGLGDALGSVAPNGMSVNSAWPSWLSPIGWGQQLRPYIDTNWWVLGLFAGVFIILLGAAYWLTSHRDHGMGMIPARPGRARARASLLGPVGLAWRLQCTMLLGWGIAVAVLGGIFGLTVIEFKDYIQNNEQLQAFLQATGTTGSYTDIFFAAIMAFCAFAIAAYAVQTILQLSTEESYGRLELLLSTAVGRVKWALGHTVIVVLGIVFLGALAGFTTGLSYALVAGGDAWEQLGRVTIAGLVQVPAVLIFVGVVTAVFGLASRLSRLIAWPLFAACVLIAQLGALLQLPDWAMRLSPFYHTPPAPADTIDATALWVMTVIAAGLIVFGLIAFRRRDISTH